MPHPEGPRMSTGPASPERDSARVRIESAKKEMQVIKDDPALSVQEKKKRMLSILEGLARPSAESAASITAAERIMGREQFLGPADVEEVFGGLKEIPPVPFSTKELHRAKELGQQLILRVDHFADGTSITGKAIAEKFKNKAHDGGVFLNNLDDAWYKDEQFFTKETPRVGWSLTAPNVLEVSDTKKTTTSKNYLQQTDALVLHLQQEVFKGVPVPEPYDSAINEFVRSRGRLEKLMNDDSRKAAQELSSLKLNQLTRETFIDALYRLTLNDRARNTKQQENRYTWTTSLSSVGKLVDVGDFGSDGLLVNRSGPWVEHGRLGVSPSRFA